MPRKGKKKRKGKKGKKKRTAVQRTFEDKEAQADLMELRRESLLESNRLHNQMKISKQEKLLERKSRELQRVKQRLEEEQRRSEQLGGKDEQIKNLSHDQKVQAIQRDRKQFQLDTIEAELRKENRILSESIFKQTEELLKPADETIRRREGTCGTCDPYIKETVSHYFDSLYSQWAESSLAMVILRSWEEKHQVLEREKQTIEKSCVFKATSLQAEFERELRYMEDLVEKKDADNTDLAVQSAKALHQIHIMHSHIAKMREELSGMYSREKYEEMQRKQVEEVAALKELINRTRLNTAECERIVAHNQEVDRLENRLIDIRMNMRKERQDIKVMEKKYHELIEKWKFNEQVYRTVSNNFKFEFLPRLNKEKEEYETQLDAQKEEQEDLQNEIDKVLEEIESVDNNSKELRLKVEELSFQKRTLKNKVAKQEEELAAKQKLVCQHQNAIRTSAGSQREAEKVTKALKTTKDKAEKKLRVVLGDLKEARKLFKASEQRLLDTYTLVSNRADFLRMFQKDLKFCAAEDDFEMFVDKFQNLVNAYSRNDTSHRQTLTPQYSTASVRHRGLLNS